MPILFLDFEACLRPWSYIRSQGGELSLKEVEPEAKNLVNELLFNVPRLKIVLISEFRIGRSVKEIKNLLGDHYYISGSIIDTTPILKGQGELQEIKHWIRTSKIKVGNYSIVSSDPRSFFEDDEDFFEIDSEEGMTEELYLKVLNHLL